MVIEHKLVFDLGDILRVRLDCADSDCIGEVVVPLKGTGGNGIPEKCPSCGKLWTSPNHGTLPEVDLLKKIRTFISDPSPRINMRFEMDEDEMDE